MPRRVTRFEADLLRILHGVLTGASAAQLHGVFAQSHRRPQALYRDAIHLIQDSLRKGVVRILATGGWRTERFIQSGKGVTGRVWERTDPETLGLNFTAATVELLLHLAATDLATDEEANIAFTPTSEPSLGDRLLIRLAADALASHGLADRVFGSPTFASDGLLALSHPEIVAAAGANEFDIKSWINPPGSNVLESLQSALAADVGRTERNSFELADGGRLRKQGEAQDAVFSAFLESVEAAGRRDLARFLLVAAADVLNNSAVEQYQRPAIDFTGLRLADRAELRRCGLAFPRAILRLRDWAQDARTVAYYDDDYTLAQLWLSDWESLRGDDVSRRATNVVQIVGGLAAAG